MRNVKKAMTGIICITLLLKSNILTIARLADLSAEHSKKECKSEQISLGYLSLSWHYGQTNVQISA